MRMILKGLCVGAALLALALPAAWAEEEDIPLDKLPKPVTAAVKAKFPDAELKSAAREEADGKTIYEVTLKSKGHVYDVSLTPEGTITEIEKTIVAADFPKAVTKALSDKYPKSTIEKAEEISKEGKTTYEAIIVTADKKKLEVVLDATGKILKEEAKTEEEGEEEEKIPLDKVPKIVKDAVTAKFPKAEWVSCAKENEDGTLVYEVVLKDKGQTVEVILSLEGKITAIEKTIEAKDLPAKVSKALAEKHPKATIVKTEELIKDGKTSYEVIIETADKKKLEVVFDPDGKVIEEEAVEDDKD
jgi:uncharacterized membrane protein YkoI